jgi:hypothetical protein
LGGPYLNSPAPLGGTATAAAGGAAFEIGTAGAIGLAGYAVGGGYLIGIALGLDRDAEAYPGGVNGVSQVWPGPMPAISASPEFQLTPLPSMPPPTKPPCDGKATTGFPGEDPEDHHRLPEQFKPWFEASPRNLNIENYKTPMPMQWHRGADIGLHPDYNAAWQNFINAYPNASADQTLQFMNQLENSMGFGTLPP